MDIIIELFNTFAGTLGNLLFPVIFAVAVALVLNALGDDIEEITRLVHEIVEEANSE